MDGRVGATFRVAKYVPAIGWLPAYRLPWLRGDLAAGVTTAAVVIPQAMAYATIAGLPVQTGLYVATVPMLVYALLGTSRPLSVSTTSTLAALTAAAVAVAAQGDPSRAPAAAAVLAVVSGGLLLLAGLLLGLRRYAPRSVPGPLIVSPSGSCWPSGLAWPTGAWPWSVRSPPASPSSSLPTWPWWRRWSRRQPGGRVVTAVVVVLTLLFLTPLFENLPQATLGAVIVAVAGLVDLAALRRVRDLRVRDFGLALVALAGVLVLGVLQGVLLAVVVSMLTLVHGANHPPIEVLARKLGTGSWRDRGRHPDETVPGLLVLRPVASIYFANGPRVRRRLLDLIDTAAPRPEVVLIDFGAVPDIDVTALEVLASFDADLRERRIALWLANLNARPLAMLRRLPDAAVWERRLFREVDDAVTTFAAR